MTPFSFDKQPQPSRDAGALTVDRLLAPVLGRLNIELHRLALGQAAEALADDGGLQLGADEMYETR